MAKKSSSEMPGVIPIFRAGPGRARRCEFGEAQRTFGRAVSDDSTVAQDQIGGVDFQIGRRQPQEFVFDFARRADGGAAGHHRRSAGVAAVAVGNLRRVAMHDAHVVDGTLQLVGDDLAQRGGDALADGVAAGIEDDLAGVVDLDASIFPRADAAGFDEAADADADGAPSFFAAASFFCQFS